MTSNNREAGQIIIQWVLYISIIAPKELKEEMLLLLKRSINNI